MIILVHLVLLGFLLNDGKEPLLNGLEIDGKDDSSFFGYLHKMML